MRASSDVKKLATKRQKENKAAWLCKQVAEKKENVRRGTDLVCGRSNQPLLHISSGSMIGRRFLPWITRYPIAFIAAKLLTLPAIWVGWGLCVRGFRNLANGHPNMDSLIAVGTSAAFLYSLYRSFKCYLSIILLAPIVFLNQLVWLSLLFYWGNIWRQLKGRTHKHLKFDGLVPNQATVIRYGEVNNWHGKIPSVGDIVRIGPGERRWLDGVLAFRTNLCGMSLWWQVKVFLLKNAGDDYECHYKSTGFIDYKATKVSSDTTLAQIVHLVEEASRVKGELRCGYGR